MIDNKNIWIETGYSILALEGINALKIEKLAKKAGISKSSFYHHFVDLTLFIPHLLNHHLQQSQIIAEKEKNCLSINPELIEVMVTHKIDLLFNRQLRINAHYPLFQDTLQKSSLIIGNAFILIWEKELNLKLTPQQIVSLYDLALGDFFLQINNENLNQEWLSAYFIALNQKAKSFNIS